nr:hypothetical protein [Tanacetum cinerariifolium]
EQKVVGAFSDQSIEQRNDAVSGVNLKDCGKQPYLGEFDTSHDAARRMIPEPGDANREVSINKTFHEQIGDELTEKELKQVEADDQAIQNILLGLPEDIYAAVDSCETTQEIWLHVQQMMKGSDIGIQEKKAKSQVVHNAVQNPGVQNVGNQNELIVVPMITNQNPNKNGNVVAARAEGNATGNNGIQLQAEEFDLMAAAADLDEIKEVNANCILMANLHQASTSGTQTDTAPVYDSDGSAEQNLFETSNLIAKEADESLAKHKALELEIERLLRAIVSQDIMSIVQNNFVEDASNLQTKLEQCKYDKILYDKAYKDMKQKIERLQDQLGDLRGKMKDTLSVSNTLDPWSQKIENENVELEFQGLPKIDETHALSKLVTSNSVPTPQESKVMKNDNVIASKMFRINHFKPFREEKCVPNKARASVRTKPITVSQPHVITKTYVNSDSNGFSSTGVDNTAKTRRPQPRSNTKNDRASFASKSSCNKNNEVEVEEHLRNLLLSKNKKHMSSKCNNVKLAIRDDKSKVVCAMCKQYLITTNHDVCVLNYVNDMNSRGKKLKANVSKTETQKKQKPKVMKSKKVGYHIEHLCPSCEQGKSKRASHPSKPVLNFRQRLHLLHMDLCGPMRIASINGKRTKKIMETMNLTFDELSAMAFEQSSLKLGLQGMTSRQITMYDDHFRGQPSAAPRTVLAAQVPQVRQTPAASTTIADTTPTSTNSSSQATNFLNTSQDVDELETQQHVLHQPETVADNVLSSMFDENTFTKDHPLEQVIGEPSRPVLIRNQLRSDGDMCMYALTVSTIEPKNVKEVMTDPAWIESMQEELLQFKRLDKSLKKYRMETCDPVGTPMEIKDKLDLDQNGTLVDATKYRSMIGALMYLKSSRPDIVHATCLCARYHAKPTEKHLNEVKRIFRYL